VIGVAGCLPQSVRKNGLPGVNGESAFNLAIMRVNRIEVVCLQSRNIVIRLRTKPYCLFFRTNQREGDESSSKGAVNFFYFGWLACFFLDGTKLVLEAAAQAVRALASKHQPGF
jgi:hypothetical protein